MKMHRESEGNKQSRWHSWLSSLHTKKNSKDVIEVGSKAAGAWSMEVAGKPEGKYHQHQMLDGQFIDFPFPLVTMHISK